VLLAETSTVWVLSAAERETALGQLGVIEYGKSLAGEVLHLCEQKAAS